MDATQAFQDLQLRLTDPIQFDYEVIRPILLDDQTIAERSRQTAIERTVIGDKARRFVQEGMLGLVDQRATNAGRKPHDFPSPVARYILHVKQMYPPIHLRELVRIVERKFGYTTNHHTMKHFLARHPIPEQLTFKFTTYHDFEDAYRARWLVVRMAYEGWNDKSIARCLKLSRHHVIRIRANFDRDGFAGLEDHRTRTITHPSTQLTLPLLKEVLDLQHEYPQAGRFRIHGILTQRHGTHAPGERTVGRAMAKNRHFHGAPGPSPAPSAPPPKVPPIELPFQPHTPHQYWCIDIRYLVRIDGYWVYSICMIEGYSRKIVVGMVSSYQDELAILQVLHAAFTEYGCPHGVVSDNGAVFTGRAYRSLLDQLDIAACYIEKGEPWQNLIEAQFKIQLRLADAKFARATTVEEVQRLHLQFVQTFNTTPHWAHRERADERRTPTAVLSWVRGRPIDVGYLQAIVRGLPFERTVNQHGFVSIQRFSIYTEPRLAQHRVTVWIMEGRLQIQYQQTLLARYDCTFDRKAKRLQAVSRPTVYRTPFRSPHLEFFELDDAYWCRVWQRPPLAPRRTPMLLPNEQLSLVGWQGMVLLMAWLTHATTATLRLKG